VREEPVDYVFGLARNERRRVIAKAEWTQARPTAALHRDLAEAEGGHGPASL